ncbi:uncharacterized protein C8R40DRAFT_1167003 [Lentinula edodes]|uniref:uncharacterized protein n=1 Tax=Lentinula edodes TaxID=5353 RepID=UPI001E8DBA8E|nr:uncharacterized protein C8R40DRAFT_1167003 [Lentinula edodes]KAH7879046.1 hypothetical protein C8R40DRAFT_1167003 [Lentinula edodes]
MTTSTQITEGWNLLSSFNEPFSPDNITFLRQCMHDFELNIRSIPMEFQRFLGLKQQCEAILRGIGFGKLSSELISEIFIHCLTMPGPEPKGSYPFFLRCSYAPFVFSQVCRRWRTVALSTPALWTRFIVVLHRTGQAELIECILERSRLLPLHVIVSSRDNGRRDNYLHAMNTLISNISRLESFVLEIPEGADDLASTLPPIPPAGAPNMRSIEFYNVNSSEPSRTSAWISELLYRSPNLRSLHLRPAEEIKLKGTVGVRLQNFKASHGIQLQDLFALLVNCAGLRTCEVQFRAPIRLGVVPPTRILLKYLHTLILTDARRDDLEAVFGWLALPSLKKLALSGFRSAEWPDELFSNFLSRSRFSLKSLSLTALSVTEAQLLSYLHLSSIHDSLEELAIRQWRPSSASFLDHLSFKLPSSDATHNPPPFLPKLSSIFITVDAITQAVALRRFVASRWYDTAAYEVPLPVASLKDIHVCLTIPYAPNVNVSIDDIKLVFSRIARSRGTSLRLETITMAPPSSNQYAGIERLTSHLVI